ncbi:MAG: methylmalonyl Co-A mutase-associated GTPase MeaB [Anaerolineales bacterium]|nr:methylmalonyl Co-A mutase-associated GTPase MeaB [Anaerolineales bacterium]MCX7755182.1 methylmalonyl Co-A mutase-associated GTPase MeaB [Anaerolineales bacterium]MDW8278777.1 methylmalonyl Co-A mutase-associated GTPase MeaB [Anaerolineales bacterium]
MELAQSVLKGDRLALARLLSRVENDTPEGRQALDALFPHTGRAHLIGVTGAPGTGKSSLVNQLALGIRKQGQRVAIVAVDPSSPFTGGAVLGDRVRMRDLSGDSGVFIRSMASRGSLGGLAATTAAITQVFDAAGFEVILIETVGAGQSEVDIARLAHTTIVVEAPGLGDDIQAIKAGILEIADILVINKADRPGVETTERALKTMLELAHPVRKVFRHHGQVMELNGETVPQEGLWIPPVLRTVATDGRGIPELLEAIARHAAHLRSNGDWARRERARFQAEFDLRLQEMLMERFLANVPAQRLESALESIQLRKCSPREAVSLLINDKN